MRDMVRGGPKTSILIFNDVLLIERILVVDLGRGGCQYTLAHIKQAEVFILF